MKKKKTLKELFYFFLGAAVSVSGEWTVCTLPGLQNSDHPGDDRSSHCRLGSDGIIGIKSASVLSTNDQALSSDFLGGQI